MFQRLPRLLVCLFALTLLCVTGCRSGAQVLSPSSQFGADAGISLADMRKDILLGATDAGWTPTQQGDKIEARIVVRGKHTVVVAIPYTTAGYRIEHVSTTNMDEKREKDGSITLHPNYNKWVSNLQQKIDKRIATSRIR